MSDWNYERSLYQIGQPVEWTDGTTEPVKRNGQVFYIGDPTTQAFWDELKAKLIERKVSESACKFGISLSPGTANRLRKFDVGRGVVVAEFRGHWVTPHYRMPLVTSLRSIVPEVTLGYRCADLLSTLGLPVPCDDGCLLDEETEEMVLKGDNLRRALIAAGWTPPADKLCGCSEKATVGPWCAECADGIREAE